MTLALRDLGKERESSPADGYLYRFGQFTLDSRKRTLSRSDSPVPRTPKAFDVLLFLARNPNRLATKEELLQAVWGDTFVEEGTLTQYISHLRKALGGNSEDARLIVTIARKGYQFTGDVTVAEAAEIAKRATLQAAADETPLAWLQLGRAQKMIGEEAATRKSCETFLDLWKNADPDIPIYQLAKAEYAKLGK